MSHLFLLVILTIASASSALADSPPNIVIIYADDMGYGDLAIQNPESKIATPNLDRLAREGLRLTDAHSSSGVCTPSRYALLTGEYHWRKFHEIVGSFGPSKFAEDQLTLPVMLKEKGYRTACIGKWHLGWDWDSIRKKGARQVKLPDGSQGFPADAFAWDKPIPDGPLSHGFDYYFGDDVPNFPPYTWIENDRVVEVPTENLNATPKTAEGSWEARPGPMATGWKLDAVMPTLTARCVQFIEEQQGSNQPFFLYFPFTSPHAPIVPVEPFLGSTEAGGYGDFVAQSDWSAGQVLAALEKYGFADNTIVIFSADNGPERYAYDRVRNHEHRSSGPLRGLKRDIWEGGHRVPTIVRWPGVIEAGRVTGALFGQIDIMPTLAELLGYELPDGAAIDGVSQLALLKGEVDGGLRDSIVHNTNAKGYAIRQGDWVLVDAPSGAVSQVPAWFDEANGYAGQAKGPALYDLSVDLGQRDNRIADYPEKANEMRALLKEIQAGE